MTFALKITIRSAQKKDSSVIAKLSSQLGYPSVATQIQKRLRKIFSHPDTIVLVAHADQKIVGWIHLFINLRIESDTFAEIGGLVVDEKYRSHGIGKLLTQEAEKRAKERGLKKLRVRSNVIREYAHRFYLNLGYKEEKIQKVFWKNLR